MEKVNGDYGNLVDVLMREQLVNSSSKELQIWLKERQPKNSEEIVEMAEAYQNAHRGSIYQKDKTKNSNAKGNANSEMNQQGKTEKNVSIVKKQVI